MFEGVVCEGVACVRVWCFHTILFTSGCKGVFNPNVTIFQSYFGRSCTFVSHKCNDKGQQCILTPQSTVDREIFAGINFRLFNVRLRLNFVAQHYR